jgi:predicted HAD superfamily Cof-like phosphohydrolase
MLKQIKQVEDFHKAFGAVVNNSHADFLSLPEDKIRSVLELRKALISEETKEVCEELDINITDVDAVKELCDLCYVIFGTVVSLGFQEKFEACFDEVHNSNMSKLGEDGKPIYREDGKVLKGPNYFQADLTKIL